MTPPSASERLSFRVNGRPVPMARPRVTAFGGYTPDSTAEWRDTIGEYAAAAALLARWQRPGAEEKLGISVMVSPQLTKAHKEPRPRSRGDLDNHVKAVLDGLTEVVFDDDAMVVSLRADFAPASEFGYLEIEVWKITARPA